VKFGVVMLAAALACAASAAGESSSFPSGWIVFTADIKQGTVFGGLFRIRTNGTGLREITKSGTSAEDPAFAPGGRRLAFRGVDGIFTVKLDGSGLRRLTKNRNDAVPAYSPGGKRIAFMRGFRLYVMQADGHRQHVCRGHQVAWGRCPGRGTASRS
jgi:Tol biopolymer transport system component